MQQSRGAKALSVHWRVPALVLCAAVIVARPVPAAASGEDPVLEWNAIMDTAVRTGTPNPIITTRVIALVNAAMFDAVNGIEQRYSPIHVNEDGPSRGSERAAAIQAAYAMLSKVYQLHPTLPAMLTTRRNESIAALATGHNAERPKAIEAGVAWGQHVADAIWDWRQNDGFNPQPPPAFWGADVVGTWRRTPGATGALANGFGTEFASMTPWVLARPSQFRAIPPHALSSPEYAADYNEVKLWGGATGSLRSADQSELVLFWNGNGPLIWNRLAARLSAERHMSMVSRARLFARLALAMADAAIACWDSKYRYVYWRPMTAIANGDSDGNDGTAGDASWQTWLAVTPAHPEYLSGHSTISGAAAHVLAAAFGENTQFWVDSDLRPGQRFFNSFSAALAEVVNARVFGGIHFRTACERGNAVGRAVANLVLNRAMRSRDGGWHHDD